eukprot:snap_masked-scaffold198_size266703-processed-gene-0.17 protein:Tk12346 transcript:snap_masked-scaffold198_size266703-processed-gene-0.17-mRNA-1 annotation:"unknown"
MAAAAPPPPQAQPGHRGPPPLRHYGPEVTFQHSDPERWVCLYPAYLNSSKTRQEGRLLPKAKCVHNPTFMEIREVLANSGWNHLVERKVYPRERSREFEFYGRLKVQLKHDDGTPLKAGFTNRESILMHVAQMVPQLKSRLNKPPPVETAPPQPARKSKKKK